jgi:hypothetical protein
MTTTILDSIIGGTHDSDLDAISDAVKQRRQILAARTVSALRPGDTVAFSDLIRPTYLIGREATVVRVNAKSVVVNCPDDPSYRRYCNAKSVRCPNSLIAGKVEA